MSGAATATATAVVFGPFIALGFWFSSIGIRLLATLKFLPQGISCFSDNWQENMFGIDPWHPPTLLPAEQELSVTRLLKEFGNEKLTEKVFTAMLLPIIYIPALLYRWSIKSTFWFYWPLLYIQRGKFNKVIDKATFNATILKHPVEQLRLVFAIVTLAILVWIASTKSTFIEIHNTNPVLLMTYLLAIDVTNIKPWHWFQLATAILTIVLWVKAWSFDIGATTAKEQQCDYDWSKVDILRRLSRARNLTTGFYLAIALVFMVLYLEGDKHLPAEWVMWLSDFFDTRFDQMKLGLSR